MQQDLLKTLRWGRTFGDVVFLLGALAMVMQVILGLLSARPALAEPRLRAGTAQG
jgi:nitric oxide reductase subunit B